MFYKLHPSYQILTNLALCALKASAAAFDIFKAPQLIELLNYEQIVTRRAPMPKSAISFKV